LAKPVAEATVQPFAQNFENSAKGVLTLPLLVRLPVVLLPATHE